MTRCPGQDLRDIIVSEHSCAGCGELVELFSDEGKTRCPTCGTILRRQQSPSCAKWCDASEECELERGE